jgi:hypothetical protein
VSFHTLLSSEHSVRDVAFVKKCVTIVRRISFQLVNTQLDFDVTLFGKVK